MKREWKGQEPVSLGEGRLLGALEVCGGACVLDVMCVPQAGSAREQRGSPPTPWCPGSARRLAPGQDAGGLPDEAAGRPCQARVNRGFVY